MGGRLAVDFGTSNTVVAVWDETKQEGLPFRVPDLAHPFKQGEEMIFVTFSDRSGRFEAIFFPRVYRRVARELFRAKGPYHIRGRVESDLGAVSVVASGVELIDPALRPLTTEPA